MKRARTLLDFWFGAPGSVEFGKPRKIWYAKDDAFDDELRWRFGALHALSVAGRLDAWQARPRSGLALVILLDQISRNIFRGKAEAFVADVHARRIAGELIRRRFDRALLPVQRNFVYLPFEHSENIADQQRSLRLFHALDPGDDYPRRHYAIIARFGRFPHRNAILGRQSTAEEIAFLTQPGSGF